jgi:chromosome segregation ATPase
MKQVVALAVVLTLAACGQDNTLNMEAGWNEFLDSSHTNWKTLNKDLANGEREVTDYVADRERSVTDSLADGEKDVSDTLADFDSGMKTNWEVLRDDVSEEEKRFRDAMDVNWQTGSNDLAKGEREVTDYVADREKATHNYVNEKILIPVRHGDSLNNQVLSDTDKDLQRQIDELNRQAASLKAQLDANFAADASAAYEFETSLAAIYQYLVTEISRLDIAIEAALMLASSDLSAAVAKLEEKDGELTAEISGLSGELASQAIKIWQLKKKLKKLRKAHNQLQDQVDEIGPTEVNITNNCTVNQTVITENNNTISGISNNGCGGNGSNKCNTTNNGTVSVTATQNVIMFCPLVTVSF